MNNRKVTKGRSKLVRDKFNDIITCQSTVWTLFHSMAKRVKGKAIGKRAGTKEVVTKTENILGQTVLDSKVVKGVYYLLKTSNKQTREIFLSDVD
jgi:hypothetical protein